MNKRLEENIKDYFFYMESLKDSIKSLKVDNDSHALIIKHLACVGLLDTLAKCVASPNPNFNNYDRFTSFIKTFCDWRECSKISLPHLVRFLQLVPSPEFADLRKHAITKLDAWQLGVINYSENDQTYKEVSRLWPKEKIHKKQIESLTLESLQHYSLFWKFRNSIVHELQIPGHGTEAIIRERPGYHGYIGSVDSQNNAIFKWQLVYPIPFILKLIDNGISNLKIYCQENKLDPYDYYKLGNYWIDKLN